MELWADLKTGEMSFLSLMRRFVFKRPIESILAIVLVIIGATATVRAFAGELVDWRQSTVLIVIGAYVIGEFWLFARQERDR